MKILKASPIALLLLAPVAAVAAQPGYLDGYYIADSKLKVDAPGPGSADDSGDGFGVRLMAPVGRGLLVAAEYQTANLDDSDIDVDQIRAGLGYMTEGPLRFGALAEYVNFQFDGGHGNKQEPDGFGLHGRIEYSASNMVTLYGQLGYLDVEDDDEADGIEWLVGASMNFNRSWGGFVDYRSASLDGDSDLDYDLHDLRLGVRWNFGVI